MQVTRLHKLAIAVAVLVLGAGSALALAGPAAASSSQWSMFEDSRHLIFTDPASRERTLLELQALGVDTLRVSVGWSRVAPNPGSKTAPEFDDTDPAAYPGFFPYDDLITKAQALGLRVMVTLGPDAPRWATGSGRGGNYMVNPDRFANFATALGKRYSGNVNGLPKVGYWSIWNEPGHALFLKPRAQAPRIYRRMVERGMPALRAAAAPGSQVFVGELAPVGTDTKVIGPLAFLRKWLCLDNSYKRLKGAKARAAGCNGFKKVVAEGFAHHPYGSQAPNTKPPPGRDIVNISVMKRLSVALDKAARAGRISKKIPIYNTEFGFQSSPPDPFVGIDLKTQARLMNEGEEISYRNSRLRSYSQYLLYDDPPRGGSAAVKWAGFQTGLRFSAGGQKPSYDAYRLPFVARKKGGGVSLWGRVRPGKGVRFVQIQRRGGGGFVNDGPMAQTDSLGYFKTSRGRASTYRFIGYVSDAVGTRTEVGTSRTASPIK